MAYTSPLISFLQKENEYNWLELNTSVVARVSKDGALVKLSMDLRDRDKLKVTCNNEEHGSWKFKTALAMANDLLEQYGKPATVIPDDRPIMAPASPTGVGFGKGDWEPH